MTRRILALALLALAGCDRTDPYLRDGVWRPAGVNAANLRAMVVVPAELAAAARPGSADGGLAVAAVNRLRLDRVRPLPDSGIAQVVPVNGGAKAQSPMAPPSAGGN